jgi:P4 family phage/plasmid primase-like protien
MSYDAIPPSLKERDCWICWREEERDGDMTKVPVDPHTGGFASTTDSETWGTFEEAVGVHQGAAVETSGVGIVFAPGDTLVGIDLDDCRDPDTGEPTKEAREIINQLESWTEVSPSGTGYHVFVQGLLPEGGNRGDIDDVSHLEMYDKKRFFTVTGEHVDTTPATVARRAETVRELHTEYVADDAGDDDSGGSETTESEPVSLEDTELLEKAKQGDKFRRLWNGDTSIHSGDHSRADLALCSKLAFWTGGDERRIDSLFRKSGLMRDKWDEQRGSETYGEMTVDKAISGQTDYYDPEKGRADGGVTADPPTTTPAPDMRAPTLSPESVKAYAGLGAEEPISALNDREKAAFVWEVIRDSDTTYVRVNRDNDVLWAFDPDTGTWSPDGERALRHAARQSLGSHHYGGNVLEELKNQVRADPAAEVWNDEFGLEAGKLAVENGLLDLRKAYEGDDDALRDLQPEDYALNRLPVAYDPEVDPETWYGFVGDVVETSMITTLQEYVGHCLHRENLFERALLLVGGGENGKSTFLNTIEAVLGDDNTTSVSPFDFGDKPSLARIHGSLANISVELEGGSLRGKNLANFKKLTGGDSIQAKRLYQGPYNFTYDGGMLFATNEVPEVPVSDDDTAFWRRWIIVHFDNQFPEGSSRRDPTLGKRLKEPENLSAVLNWAVEGWGRLLEKGEFSNVAETPDKTRQQWQSWGDSVDYFLSNVATSDDDAPNVSTHEAWGVYRHWCRENGYDFVGQSKFTNAAKDKSLGYSGSVRTDRHATPRRGYKSFGTVEEETDPIDVVQGGGDDSDSDGDDDGDSGTENTRNTGLYEYATTGDGDGDGDGAGEAAEGDGGTGSSDRDPEGKNDERQPVDRQKTENDDSDGERWPTLLADVSTHYSSGDVLEAGDVADTLEREITADDVRDGLKALADRGVIERREGDYVA